MLPPPALASPVMVLKSGSSLGYFGVFLEAIAVLLALLPPELALLPLELALLVMVLAPGS
ncbi:hypothetical protein AMTR_s00030p00198420 [Amborella trichopoda]|uniref:Uncharacterized protein n=1 Tax=Amborella trichopoda TaxID=13333 RepID=U5D1M2_AMBTC|nr:hypothetical protein AMTR_s00030p00198420 [Amborella trichopoda]